jgi:hypothetical protein
MRFSRGLENRPRSRRRACSRFQGFPEFLRALPHSHETEVSRFTGSCLIWRADAPAVVANSDLECLITVASLGFDLFGIRMAKRICDCLPSDQESSSRTTGCKSRREPASNLRRRTSLILRMALRLAGIEAPRLKNRAALPEKCRFQRKLRFIRDERDRPFRDRDS